jgi:hypothetical protein
VTDVAARARRVQDWRAILAIGLEAMDETATIAGIEARTPTDWPLAAIMYSFPGIRAAGIRISEKSACLHWAE